MTIRHDCNLRGRFRLSKEIVSKVVVGLINDEIKSLIDWYLIIKN